VPEPQPQSTAKTDLQIAYFRVSWDGIIGAGWPKLYSTAAEILTDPGSALAEALFQADLWGGPFPEEDKLSAQLARVFEREPRDTAERSLLNRLEQHVVQAVASTYPGDASSDQAQERRDRVCAFFVGKDWIELPTLTQYRLLLAIRHLVNRGRMAPQRAVVEWSIRQLVDRDRLKKVLGQVGVLWRTLGLKNLPLPRSREEPFPGTEAWPDVLQDLVWVVWEIADPRSQERLVEPPPRERALPLVRLLDAKPNDVATVDPDAGVLPPSSSARGKRQDLPSDRIVRELIAQLAKRGALHPCFDPFGPQRGDPDAVEAVKAMEEIMKPHCRRSARTLLICTILGATGLPPPAHTKEWKPESITRYVPSDPAAR
jgi:hypothetical protein